MTHRVHKASATLSALALGLSMTASAAPALAFGGGGDTPSNTPVPRASVGAQAPTAARPAKVCRKGQVWSAKRKSCIKAMSGALPDEELLKQGRLLALAGYYTRAIPVLEAVGDKTRDPLVFTYLGYSHRKLGQTELGFAYYHRALAIDPNSLNTHEYLGEGYAAIGEPQAARVELAKVETLCGNRSCEQYQDLAEAITKAK
ncbi:tetratricopeptide repeat protein [Labrys wisconsinensis]|uniref:Tetratricopeptide (TPR) repeat protein n=1 Tax=Labrys wisconsinensis TaxID=425677 RepID=A0ABU0J661_9HYPH|nr:tetratricopeptide repeat protein [Labrys wisconsinensis]MDQ0469752.1 tetratricopeptide (TPR) repeat protein [Labrys wisconsinensis]